MDFAIVPFTGLGATSAAFVGGFLAGSVLCAEELRHLEKSAAKGLPRTASKEGLDVVDCSAPNNMAGVEALLQAAIARGWNPGNVCPAIYGAIQIGIHTPNGMRSHRVPCPHGLVLCLFVPDGQEEETGLDMELVDRQKAIFNVGRIALLINVFSTQDFSKPLRIAWPCRTLPKSFRISRVCAKLPFRRVHLEHVPLAMGHRCWRCCRAERATSWHSRPPISWSKMWPRPC
eukprot:symbB.v1.2.024912.t1/scaffold2390.1/size80330/11